jgi:hypothetical protein
MSARVPNPDFLGAARPLPAVAGGVDSIVAEIQKRRREIEAAGATLRVNSGTLTNM